MPCKLTGVVIKPMQLLQCHRAFIYMHVTFYMIQNRITKLISFFQVNDALNDLVNAPFLDPGQVLGAKRGVCSDNPGS